MGARLALYDRMVSQGFCRSYMDELVQKGVDTMWERGWHSAVYAWLSGGFVFLIWMIQFVFG